MTDVVASLEYYRAVVSTLWVPEEDISGYSALDISTRDTLAYNSALSTTTLHCDTGVHRRDNNCNAPIVLLLRKQRK